MRYPWWQFKPHPEWLSSHATKENHYAPYAAGVPREVRVVYIPGFSSVLVKGIEPDTCYRAFYMDPKDGEEIDLGEVAPDEDGNWQSPKPPIFQDWVLVLERKK